MTPFNPFDNLHKCAGFCLKLGHFGRFWQVFNKWKNIFLKIETLDNKRRTLPKIFKIRYNW